MKEPLTRLDSDENIRTKILPYCRLKYGEIWEDKLSGHKVGVLDCTKAEDVKKIFQNKKAVLSIQDTPYNVIVGNRNTDNLFKMDLERYIEFSYLWVKNNKGV